MRSKLYTIVLSFLLIAVFSFNQALGQVQQNTLHDIQLLLQEKQSRTPVERKIDSRLLQAMREKSGQPMVQGVNLAPVNVNADNAGNLKVDINAAVSDGLISRIESLGGHIIFPSWQYHSIRAEINLSMVATIAAYPEVKFIEPAVGTMKVGTGLVARPVTKTSVVNDLAPVRVPDGLFGKIAPQKPSFADRAARIRRQLENYLRTRSMSQKPFTGTVNSEGDRAHRADDARNTYGYTGQGIKIGVLSDSYNNLGGAAADIASGNLPGPGNPLGNTTPVTVVQDLTSGGTDEGRAMVQIVHDVAPQAQLFFASADFGEASFASNIQTLRNSPNNCDIIIDDIFYFDESPFQDGIIAQAVNTVTAAGALYFSSAGNEGNLAKNTSGYFEGDFNDAGSLAFTFPGGAKAGTIHNFGTVSSPVNGDIITATGEAYTLNWSDPAGGSNNDYDLFILTSTGTVKSQSTNIQNGTQNPFEQITPPALAAGDRMVVFKTAAAAVRAFAINSLRGTLTIATTGQTHGHSSAVNAFSVAATPAAGAFGAGSPTGPYPNPFSASNNVETFTSDGPRRVFYDASGNAITPGNLLFGSNGGAVRNKPDITAADGVSTTLPSSSGLNPFYGTSAAAPHAGAIAALLKSANPALTPAQIRTLLTTTALDIESAGYDNISGSGIVQAFQAMQSLSPTALSNITIGTVTPSEGAFANGNGSIDPGELGNLVIQLKNLSLVTSTNVNATLTTSTSGITILQGTSSYGSIAASGNAANSATPYKFAVNASVPCGTTINFILTVTYGGGGQSPRIFQVPVNVGTQPGGAISSSLGLAPPVGPGYTSTSGQQTGRLSRSGVVATCAAPKANPGLTVATGSRQFDAYTFTNTGAAQCVTVTLTSSNGINLYTAAYTSAGFVPANPSTNFLADPGSSSATQQYSFTAPAGQAFTVVVHDVNVLPTSGSSYTLSVSLSNCNAAPTCTPVVVAPATIPAGVVGTAYSQVFTASGGSGSYTFSETGTLPNGITFTGNTLSGTPTQSGSFPITVTATDAAGCPTGTQNYTLVINTGTSTPASVTATAGTPQSAPITTTFATALQATVKDASSVPVSGVTVTFTAPSSGASGTFPGAVITTTAVTNVSGVATAPAFTANGTTGSYNVAATVVGVATPANFALTNTAATTCTLTCPANIVVSNQANQCGAIVTYTAPTQSGSCGTVTTTPASGSFFPVGTTTVVATSTSGATCSFTVRVNDTQAPTITCPANITVSNQANQCGAAVTFTAPTATDNCSGTTVVSTPASGSFFPIGSTTVTSTATDAAGNTATCTFTVKVNDTQAPVITCPANINVNAPAGQCAAVVTYSVPTATDNCPGTTVTFVSGLTSGSSFPAGVNTVTYKATDAAGNTSTCSFTATVTAALPTIISQPVTLNACAGDNVNFSVTATNVASYQWQKFDGTTWNNIAGATASTFAVNGVTIALNTSSYRVVVTGICGTSIISNTGTLYVNALPIVSIGASPTSSVTPGHYVTLTVLANPPGGSISWYKNGVLLPGIISVSIPNISVNDIGTYKVVYTDQNGCTSTSANFDITPGGARTADFMSVYPNPNTGQFVVRFFNQLNEVATLIVLDEQGETVYQNRVTTGIAYSGITVDLGKNSSGIYLVELHDSNNKIIGSKKIIVLH